MQITLVLILVVLGLTTIFQAVVTFFIQDRLKRLRRGQEQLNQEHAALVETASREARDAANAVMTRRAFELDNQRSHVNQQVERASRILAEIQEEKVVLTKVIMEFTDLIRDFRRDLKEAKDGGKA